MECTTVAARPVRRLLVAAGDWGPSEGFVEAHSPYRVIACTTSSLDSCLEEADLAARAKGIARDMGPVPVSTDRIGRGAEEMVMAVARMEQAKVVYADRGTASRMPEAGHSLA